MRELNVAYCKAIQKEFENFDCSSRDKSGIEQIMNTAIGDLPCQDLTLCGFHATGESTRGSNSGKVNKISKII